MVTDIWSGNATRAIRTGSGERITFRQSTLIMAGLVPAIHVLRAAGKNVDAREKPGHDEYHSKRTGHDHPRSYGNSYTTILSAMPRSAASFWIGRIE
jgi:hypothetical protein